MAATLLLTHQWVPSSVPMEWEVFSDPLAQVFSQLLAQASQNHLLDQLRMVVAVLVGVQAFVVAVLVALQWNLAVAVLAGLQWHLVVVVLVGLQWNSDAVALAGLQWHLVAAVPVAPCIKNH